MNIIKWCVNGRTHWWAKKEPEPLFLMIWKTLVCVLKILRSLKSYWMTAISWNYYLNCMCSELFSFSSLLLSLGIRDRYIIRIPSNWLETLRVQTYQEGTDLGKFITLNPGIISNRICEMSCYLYLYRLSDLIMNGDIIKKSVVSLILMCPVVIFIFLFMIKVLQFQKSFCLMCWTIKGKVWRNI